MEISVENAKRVHFSTRFPLDIPFEDPFPWGASIISPETIDSRTTTTAAAIKIPRMEIDHSKSNVFAIKL